LQKLIKLLQNEQGCNFLPHSVYAVARKNYANYMNTNKNRPTNDLKQISEIFVNTEKIRRIKH